MIAGVQRGKALELRELCEKSVGCEYVNGLWNETRTLRALSNTTRYGDNFPRIGSLGFETIYRYLTHVRRYIVFRACRAKYHTTMETIG